MVSVLQTGLVGPEGIEECPETEAESQPDRRLSNIEEREHQSLLVYRERMRIEPRGFLRTKSTIGRPNGGIVGTRPAAALRRFPASQGLG
jgi:hypothetical protein